MNKSNIIYVPCLTIFYISDDTAVILSGASDEEMNEEPDDEMELNRDMKRADLESGSAASDASSTSSSDGGKSLFLGLIKS